MKKKSPPYAIIGAALLGIVLIFGLIQYSKKLEQDKQDALTKADADKKKAIEDALKAEGEKKPIVVATANSRPVLYATQDVQPGVLISPAFYEKKLTPDDILPDAFTEATDITGWVAIRPITKGDPLTPRNIGHSLPNLTTRISPGMRAICIPVFTSSGDYNNTGGFAVDGDRVDLLFTATYDGKAKVNTQTVMQNVKVLFVPGPQNKTEQTQGVNPVGSAGPIGITFEVTPEQAQALVLLSNVTDGHFTMILRALKDTSEVKLKPFDIRDYDILRLNGKVQNMVDKSQARVNDLAQQIADKEKAAQGSTNETKNPTPPTP